MTALPTVPVRIKVYDPSGSPVAAGRVTARLDRTDYMDGYVIAPETLQGETDDAGLCTLNLWPNELGTSGSLYKIVAYNPDDQNRRYLNVLVAVPKAACQLEHILQQQPFPPIDAAQAALQAAQGALADVTEQAQIATAKAAEADADAISAVSSATAAGLSESSASASASSASISEGNAATSASTAGQQAGYATSAAAMADESADAALASQNAAANSASAADKSASEAAEHRTLAQDWATKTSGEVVAGQGYGAKKYAQDASAAQAAAQASADSFATSLAAVATNLVSTQAMFANYIATHP